MVQKFYAIKSEKAIAKGTIISTVFALVVAGGCYFLGGFGRLISTPETVAETGFDAIIPTMLSNLPDIIIGVVIVLVLSASMSTLSSLVLASSSTLTLDFLKGNIIKEMKESTQLITMRLLIVVFIGISVVIAIVQYTSSITFIAQLMGISWGTLAGAFLAPFLYGLYMKKTSKAAIWFCFIFSTVLMTTNLLFRPSFPVLLQSPINCGAFAMIVGLIAVPLISFITKSPKKEVVDEAFKAYEEKVTVSVKTAIED
jgi:SSS family solute:Na+ symporter